MENYKLIDVVLKGSNARRHIDPNLIIALKTAESLYNKGDILDGNAVEELILSKIKNITKVSSSDANTIEDIQNNIRHLTDVINNLTGQINKILNEIEDINAELDELYEVDQSNS